jgi:hypothetical protein
MQAISDTARSMAIDNIGLDDKFRMPRGNNDQNLLNTARMFVADAPEYENDFLEYGLPDNFITALNSDINAFEISVTGQNDAREEQAESTAAIDTAIENGTKTVKRLDVIVTNKYRNNAANSPLGQVPATSNARRKNPCRLHKTKVQTKANLLRFAFFHLCSFGQKHLRSAYKLFVKTKGTIKWQMRAAIRIWV